MKVNIFNPLYDDFCYIRASIVDQAIRRGEMLEVTIPQGTATIDPREWVKTGKVMHKEFKIKGKPMKLIGNHVFEKEEKPQQMTLNML